MSNNENKSQAYNQGVMVLVGLAILTGLEYWIAMSWQSTLILAVIAMIKAIVIVQYFMHIGRVGDPEGGH